MELLNHTAHEARLFRTVLSEDEMLGVVVVKATYRVGDDGRVVQETERPLPIHTSFLATELGQQWPDSIARKFHTEVSVFGKALAPGGRPVASMDASVRVGDREARLRVFGPRVWQRRRLSWQVGPAAPFAEMPLVWARAYGGRARAKGRPLPFAQNAHGRGFVVERGEVEGTPLPNLEDPHALITHWRQQPRPLAFAPLPLGSSLCELACDSDEDALVSAPAAMRGYPILQGQPVVLRGLSLAGIQAFALDVPCVFARVDIGGKKPVFHCGVDTLHFYPQQGRYTVTARRSFRYRPDAPARVVRLHEEKGLPPASPRRVTNSEALS